MALANEGLEAFSGGLVPSKAVIKQAKRELYEESGIEPIHPLEFELEVIERPDTAPETHLRTTESAEITAAPTGESMKQLTA